MTSGQESSNLGVPPAPYSEIESLAGVFHPHAIEVQDFSYYALMIDVRSKAEYDDDHIPGAVQLTPPHAEEETAAPRIACDSRPDAKAAGGASAVEELPEALAALVAPVERDKAILLYCGRGGRDSQPLAKALRWRGWTADVLPGGWINYRRWVQAGLEVLPRLVTFRVIASSLGSEVVRVLSALRELEHQVLDVEALAGWSRGALRASSASQPSQAWFESQLLQAIRGFDPRSPVWIDDLGPQVGTLSMPGALTDALTIAPMTSLQVTAAERVRCWWEDQPQLGAEPSKVVEAVARRSPPPSTTLLTQLQRAASKGLSDLLLARLLADCIDPAYTEESAGRCADRHVLPPLVVESLASRPLAEVVRVWLRAAAPSPSAG